MWDIELRLVGHSSPAGALKALDAARLAGAVSDVIYRITRDAAGVAGLGRTQREVERLAETRLSGLSGRGTTLRFTVGEYDPEGTFPMEFDPFAGGVQDLFADIVAGMAANRRPAGVTDTIAAATGGLVRALQAAAPQVRIGIGERRPVTLRTGDIVRPVWHPRGHDAPQTRSVEGLLEMVDIHFGHFRLLDTEGRRIEVHEITDPDRAARLVGGRVTVHGFYFPPVGSARPRMEDVTVQPLDDAQQMPFAFVEQAEDAASTLLPAPLFSDAPGA